MTTIRTPAMPAARPINYAVVAEVLILGGTATLFLMKWARGNLDYYIHPRYTILVVAGAICLLMMAGVRLRGVFIEPRSRTRLTWMHLLLAMPLLFGVLVPSRPLGADTLAGRGLDLTVRAGGSPQQASSLPANVNEWNLFHWNTGIGMMGTALDGEAIDVEGFVYHDATLGADEFYVARFVITCCAADGVATGLPVRWANGSSLPLDAWVRVQGTLVVETVGDEGMLFPVIDAAQVEPIEQPRLPYLFP